MTSYFRVSLLALLVALTGCANMADRIVDRAGNVAERAVNRNVDSRTDRAINGAIDGAFQGAENAVRCTYDDSACVERAQNRGENVVLVDRDGTPVDRNGNPVSESNAQDAIVRAPGVSGANANYDFVPGERVLFEDDFSRDNIGDFPRRLEFREGSMEVVSFDGGRALRGKTDGAFNVNLPSVLPDQFTLEFDFQATDFVNGIWVYVADADGAAGPNYIQVDPYAGVGVAAFSQFHDAHDANAVSSVQQDDRLNSQMLPIRVMVDGSYVKVFVGEERVANVPNANLGRSNKIQFLLEDVREEPVYIANIRIAAGGRDLYSALEAEGRVVTEGILFATGSATLQSESFAVVQEIATMMQQHPDLRVRVEGHTDSSGQAATNQTLSESRANAVRTMLIGLGIDAGRVEAAGMGSSRPIADNGTPEGQRQNRRVELVRL